MRQGSSTPCERASWRSSGHPRERQRIDAEDSDEPTRARRTALRVEISRRCTTPRHPSFQQEDLWGLHRRLRRATAELPMGWDGEPRGRGTAYAVPCPLSPPRPPPCGLLVARRPVAVLRVPVL